MNKTEILEILLENEGIKYKTQFGPSILTKIVNSALLYTNLLMHKRASILQGLR